MSILQIRKAKREGARLIIGLAGPSGEGKTFSALLLAYGLARGDGTKVGVLDTENRRGSLYADEPLFGMVKKQLGMKANPEPFLIGDLYAPFSPSRYIEAIKEFQAAGVEVLVIDSATHEYEGTGGCIEIAEAGNPKIPNWNRAKAEHKRFMNAVLQCDMHVIFCVRAREKATPEKVDGKTVFRDLGMQPIQEKNFMFEMTASLMLRDSGARQDVMKCPADLRGIMGRGEGYLTAADGLALRAWVDGAKQLDPNVERYRNALQMKTEAGVSAVRDAWGKTPDAIKQALGDGFLKTLLAAATEYDNQQPEADAAVAALNAAAAKVEPAATTPAPAAGVKDSDPF